MRISGGVPIAADWQIAASSDQLHLALTSVA
jgi:hypothetical protein